MMGMFLGERHIGTPGNENVDSRRDPSFDKPETSGQKVNIPKQCLLTETKL